MLLLSCFSNISDKLGCRWRLPQVRCVLMEKQGPKDLGLLFGGNHMRPANESIFVAKSQLCIYVFQQAREEAEREHDEALEGLQVGGLL